MAVLTAHGASVHTPRVPPSADPKKCDLEMAPAAFRSWRRFMECWLLLCRWPQREAVHHVRLHCTPALQRAIDAKFTFGEWGVVIQDTALDTIGLKQVYEICDNIDSVDTLRVMCCSYEAARRDAAIRSLWRETCRAAGTVIEQEEDQPCDVGSATTAVITQAFLACWNCGAKHAPGKASCPAKEATCLGCRKRGHFKRCYRSSKRSDGTLPGNVVSVSVTTAATHLFHQPTVDVMLTPEGAGAKHHTAAVVDTGAQVCVAGATLLSSLHIKPAQFRKRTGLRHVADLPLQCIASHPCNISLRCLVAKQDVYFLPSAKSLFLSLGACEELGLIPEGFPRHHSLAVRALATNTVAESSHHPHTKPSSRFHRMKSTHTGWHPLLLQIRVALGFVRQPPPHRHRGRLRSLESSPADTDTDLEENLDPSF
ncbi:hypothetical protein O3P69_008169 [Scylla paramamosain]|uniref:Uncharacterized protein n=1 Tax=Scylla paramamosain TaxID=85552 RepID=A0AAW0T1I9_SCYPA